MAAKSDSMRKRVRRGTLAYLRRNDALPWILGISISVALLVWFWVLFSPEAGFPGLILVAGGASLLFIVFYGLATGSLSFGKNQEAANRARSHGFQEAGLFIRVLDETPEAYLIVNRNGAVIYANQAYETLTQAGNRARNVGRPLPLEQVFAGDEDLAAPLYRLARAARSGETGSELLRLKTANDESRVLQATVTPIEGVRDYALYRLIERPLEAAATVDLELGTINGDEVQTPAEGMTLDLDAQDIVDVASAYGREDLSLFKNAPLGLVILDQDGALVQANQAAQTLLGKGSDETAMSFADLFEGDDAKEVAERIRACREDAAPSVPLDVAFQSVDGKDAISVRLYLALLDGDPDSETADEVIVYLVDMREHKSLEMQMAQSQKMQAVGQLAGGVAHDFNNLLTAIIGFCDLLLTRHHAGDPSFNDIDQIRQNANRAANLVRQLLAFSRQQTLTQKVMSPTDVLNDLSMLLHRLLGEKVDLNVVHGRHLGLLKVDQSQLDTALINLSVNARDAMPDGGTLDIATKAITQPAKRNVVEDVVEPGRYVLIEVKDSGTGMPEDVLEKIFDPFFTTKGVGQGTGLGLSTVYGIIKQMDGFIFCDSEIGVGTTFRIYLPEYEETAEDKAAREESAKQEPEARDLTGMGTILLVEDEDAVRAFATRALSSRGYEVLEAANGVQALDIFKNHDGPIDLMVSDVVMPEMDGPTLAREARALKEDTKIIFISGYAEDAFKDTERPENTTFLPKPFSLKQLAAKVKEVLGE